jgi:hypothetical protein
LEKQELQYTGLSPRGWNGTCAGCPHWAHTAEYSVLPVDVFATPFRSLRCSRQF